MTPVAGDYGGCQTGHCITCADEGIPMDVVRIDEARALALCAGEDGARSTVEIALVEPVQPGDRVLVHAGVALTRLAPDGVPAP